MHNPILDLLKQIEHSPESIAADLQKIKALCDSESAANQALALNLLEGRGYTNMQARIIRAFLAEELELNHRVAADIIDLAQVEVEGVEFGLLNQAMLKQKQHPVANLLHELMQQPANYPENPNIEISLEKVETYFYFSFIADQLPFCVLGETVLFEDLYRWSGGATHHLLSVSLMSDIPKSIMPLAPCCFSLDLKSVLGDQLLDWVNFKGDEAHARLEMILESLGDQEWGMGIGFYNEKNNYISICDIEVHGAELLLNQDDLTQLKKAYPQYLVPKAYKKGTEVGKEDLKQVWTYNLLKNYL